MNDRKQHVIKMAHQLFIDKGFQATSIQDILEYSGISKGTFYNYFASKNELLIAIFTSSYAELQKMRDEILLGQDPSNIETFIRQIEIQLKTNRKKKLITLFEEVLFSNNDELKTFFQQGQIRNIRWLYQRFVDIFGENKKPYLLDCAIMFMGMLRENIKFYQLAHSPSINISQIVRFTVNRLVHMVEEAAESDSQLIDPQVLEEWLPDCGKPGQATRKKLQQQLLLLKNCLYQQEEHRKYIELVDVIEEEIESKNPRVLLIESILHSLQMIGQKEIQQLEQLVTIYISQLTN
ncbi:TetR/AcrR family transcriptional regulator [Bacillus rubiinfantis]|uniref:TetR/AcrR family transcriptional regulator n=1 Tax=Bacillus rubiinfantis TaxID=1499680 RepID=UPI0005A851B9|nr:TetR/AcrR family transcriptional regulator [Bacillus rubiinfantis]